MRRNTPASFVVIAFLCSAALAATPKAPAAGPERYVRQRTRERQIDLARRIDFAPLRRAVRDLSETFGETYPRGREYLARLETLAQLREVALKDGAVALDKLTHVAEGYESLRAEALLANPLLDFDRLLVVKRRGHLGLPQNWQGNCALPRGRYDNEVASLSPVRPEGKLTTLYRPPSGRFVGDVDLHWDADRMLFSMRDDNGRFQIYEAGVDGQNLRQVTRSERDIDNYDACYLPDGRIIFASTACFQGVPCVGGGNQVATLYLMNEDGRGIRQLCFDQDHDWCPTVTHDGRVMYTRWEYSDTPHYFTRVLFQMNPDGSGQTALYGSNSYWPNSIFYARPIPGHPSKFVGVISGHHGVPRMGELIVFDPAVGRHEAEGAVQRIPGYGERILAIIQDSLVNASWPKFLHPYPLSEKYFLVSCQPNRRAKWGIYLVDVFDNSLLLCEQPDYALLEPIPLRRTLRPPVIPDKVDLGQKDAVVHLSDVYAGKGLAGVPRGTVKTLRLFAFDYGYQGLANHTYIGIEGPWEVHRILGTVEVEEDGSAVFRVPANTPIAVQPLDAEGKALQLMRSWFVAMPGEHLSCVGCHDSGANPPPLRSTVAARNPPQEIRDWFGPARGFSFKREVQPVVDRYCVGCHDGRRRHGGRKISDLRPGRRGDFTRAYRVLQAYVRRPGPESDYHMMPPAEYHADTSPLIQMLAKGHHGVKLDREAWERLYTWIDLNVPDHGTWNEFRDIPGQQHLRRYALRKKYANIEIDYEAIPDLPAKRLEAILPETVDLATPPVHIECPGWPFDAAEARRRQGDDPVRKITVATDSERPIEFTLVRIPAGEFVMGNAAGFPDERPPFRAAIDRAFWMATSVITNEQFRFFDPTHDSRYLDRPGKDHSNRGIPLNRPHQPVVRISWERAMAFCRWLSEKCGREFTLPTEVQWEYACRAGVTTDAARRGHRGHNMWGLREMPAGVSEWTRTAYRPYPSRSDDGRDDASAAGRKVVRGGSFSKLPDHRRATLRLSYHSWQGVYNVGFRVICESETPAPSPSGS